MNLTTLKDTPPWEWPDGTAATLLDILRGDGGSASDLLLAAELAGDLTVINAELVDALLAILRRSNTPEAVRGQAAISLEPVLEHADTGSFEDPDDLPITERSYREIQESLHELYLDANVPSDVRRRILEASVRAPQAWHGAAIRAAYGSGDEAWRLTAVFCMRFVRGFEEQILEALASTNPISTTRRSSRQAIGDWTPPGCPSPPSSPRGRPRSLCSWRRSRRPPASGRTKRSRSSMTSRTPTTKTSPPRSTRLWPWRRATRSRTTSTMTAIRARGEVNGHEEAEAEPDHASVDRRATAPSPVPR
jgi:hypothetical protein